MWREEYGSTQDPVAAISPREAGSGLADRITEDVLQLLYAAGQEIADARASCPEDVHAPLAAQRVHEAIASLREIAALVRGPKPEPFGSVVSCAAPVGPGGPVGSRAVLPGSEWRDGGYREGDPDRGASA